MEYLRTTALDGRTAALGGPTTALDGRTTTELESNIMAGHASTSEVPMPALSSSPPVPTSASRIVDDSRIVSAIVMGDRSGKPNTRMSQRDDNAALESVQDVAALPDEQGTCHMQPGRSYPPVDTVPTGTTSGSAVAAVHNKSAYA